jgi:hypothetical protein
MKAQERIEILLDTQKARFFRFQKNVFLVELKAILDEEGIEAKIVKDVYRKQIYQSLIIGNLLESNKLVIGHFDTPSWILDNFKFKPFEIKKRQRISLILEGIKFILVTFVNGIILLSLFERIISGENVVLFSALSLLVFLSSVFLFRLPGIIPSQKNKNRQTLSLLMKRALEKETDTSFVIVDDGSAYQLGYQILGSNLRQVNKNYEIELIDQINASEIITEVDILDKEKTRLKYFDFANVKAFTS